MRKITFVGPNRICCGIEASGILWEIIKLSAAPVSSCYEPSGHITHMSAIARLCGRSCLSGSGMDVEGDAEYSEQGQKQSHCID